MRWFSTIVCEVVPVARWVSASVCKVAIVVSIVICKGFSTVICESDVVSISSSCEVVLCYVLLRGGSLLCPFVRWCILLKGGCRMVMFFLNLFSRHVFYWPIFCVVVEALTPCLHGGIASRPLLCCVMLSTWSCFVSTLAHLLVINLVEEKRAFHSLQTIGNMSIYYMCNNSYTSIFKL